MSFSPEEPGQQSEPYPFYLPPPPPPLERTAPVALWIGIAGLLVVSLGVGSWLLAGNYRVVAGHPPRPSSTASGGGTAPRGGTAPGGGKVITATDNKSQITVPGTWWPPPAAQKVDRAVIQMGGNGGNVVVFTDAKADVVDFAAFEQWGVEGIKPSLKDATVGERRTLTIGALPAVQYVATGSIDGVNMVYWVTFVDGNNGWHELVCGTLRSRKDAEGGSIDEVIKSFRELSSPA